MTFNVIASTIGHLELCIQSLSSLWQHAFEVCWRWRNVQNIKQNVMKRNIIADDFEENAAGHMHRKNKRLWPDWVHFQCRHWTRFKTSRMLTRHADRTAKGSQAAGPTARLFPLYTSTSGISPTIVYHLFQHLVISVQRASNVRDINWHEVFFSSSLLCTVQLCYKLHCTKTIYSDEWLC